MTRKEKRQRRHYKRLMSDRRIERSLLNRKRRNRMKRFGKRLMAEHKQWLDRWEKL